jgi:branched-chain amino acid transport system substrate-binding protein
MTLSHPGKPDRRTLLKGALAAAAAGSALSAPAVHAQGAGPIRLGFLTIKTGPLASGGIQMEQGLTTYLKQRNNMLGGRPVQVFTADTGGSPAMARTKLQELVERNNIHVMVGPLAAFELLAIDDYIRSREIPTLTEAAAEDITQRNANPWVVRPLSSAAQCSYPMGDYAAKELKFKRVATLADDFAFGHECVAGFHRAFEDNGAKVVQKLWPPLVTPDYGTYIAQLKPDLDGVFMAFAGSNGFKFFKQYKEYGGTAPVLGGQTAVDESVLQQMGDDAIGLLSTCWYSAVLDNPENKRFVEDMNRDYKVDPGQYAAGTHLSAQVLDAALHTVNGNADDKKSFMRALREAKVPDTVRGPISFDKFGNAVGNVYIRKVERKGGKLVNTVIKTYPDVSQFWTYNPDEFMKAPVYSRDYPPCRNCEA